MATVRYRNARRHSTVKAIGTLAGGIAHDFNNILAIIQGNVELARQDAANSLMVVESLEEIRKACVHARALVQQILVYSRRQHNALAFIDLA